MIKIKELIRNRKGIAIWIIIVVVIGIIIILSLGFIYNLLVNTPISKIKIGDCVYDKSSNSYGIVKSISNNAFQFNGGSIGFLTDKNGNPSGFTSLKIVSKNKC